MSELLERIYLALHQPATWYAIATGAGVFGVPVGWAVAWWRGRRKSPRTYTEGYNDGCATTRRSLLMCARDWGCEDPPDWQTGETFPPKTLREWVEHAERRH